MQRKSTDDGGGGGAAAQVAAPSARSGKREGRAPAAGGGGGGGGGGGQKRKEIVVGGGGTAQRLDGAKKAKRPTVFQVGELVQAIYPDPNLGGAFFGARISKVHDGGKEYTLDWDDGDSKLRRQPAQVSPGLQLQSLWTIPAAAVS